MAAGGAGFDMVSWRKMVGLTVLFGGVLMGLSPQSPAATSSTSDILSDERAADAPDSVDIGRVTPIARPTREAAKPPPSGNPLWAVPLSALSTTQQRPIFSASRRPPPPAVVAPVLQAKAAPPPKPAEPERLALSLIGAVVGDSDAIAVFLDRTNQKIVRLRQGDSHAGWLLSSVERREVTLKMADRSEVLVLQRQEGPAGVSGVSGGPAHALPSAVLPGSVLPGSVLPTAGSVNTSYAPFIPRSTPKNGEPDGL